MLAALLLQLLQARFDRCVANGRGIDANPQRGWITWTTLQHEERFPSGAATNGIASDQLIHAGHAGGLCFVEHLQAVVIGVMRVLSAHGLQARADLLLQPVIWMSGLSRVIVTFHRLPATNVLDMAWRN